MASDGNDQHILMTLVFLYQIKAMNIDLVNTLQPKLLPSC